MSAFRPSATGLAASLLTLAIAGCPATVDPPTTPASKRPRASSSPTPGQPLPTLTPGGAGTPTAPPTGAGTPTPAGATPTPGPSGAATPAGPPPSGKTLTLGGRVFDDEGAGVGGATITATSLDTRAAFTGSATADAEGRYKLPGVPEGANIEVVAAKAGFTSRRRVGAYIADREAVTDFGAAAGATGPGLSFFLAARLEVDRLEPDAAMLAKGQLGFAVVFSGPLDAANQARALAALRVWPANEAAAPRGDANDLDDEDLSEEPDTGASRPEPVIESDLTGDGYTVDYAIKDQSPFLTGAVKAAGAWSDDGARLAFSFAAPLIRGRDEARYQVGFVRAADASSIRSTAGHALGTDKQGAPDALPPFAGNLLRNVFRAAVPTIKDEDGNGTISRNERWSSTHDTTRAFAIPRDDTAPRLEAVTVDQDVAGSCRISFRFDEPLAAYNGTPDGEVAKAIDGDDDRDGDVDLADFVRHYTFVLGDAGGATANVAMDGFEAGSADLSVDPRGVATFGGAAETRGKELAFDVTAVAFRRRLDEATTGQIVVAVDEADPRVVHLTIKGRANFLDPAVKELKARVEAVADPAGNGIGLTQADRDVRTVAL